MPHYQSSYSAKMETTTTSSRIGRIRERHSSEIEEVEKRLRILRLRTRYGVKSDRSNKTTDSLQSSRSPVDEGYKSRHAKYHHDRRVPTKAKIRSLELKGGILDTGLCALPYHGFAERFFGFESEEEDYFFTDDDTIILDDDRHEKDNEMIFLVPAVSSSRDVSLLSLSETRDTASASSATLRNEASTENHSFRDLRPVPLILARSLSTNSPVRVRDLPPVTSAITSPAPPPTTKFQEQSSVSVTSDTKKTWLNRLKCQSHAENDGVWLSKDIPHILQEYDNDHWNVCDDDKGTTFNVIQSETPTIASYQMKQQHAPRHVSRTRAASAMHHHASNPPRSVDDHLSFENTITNAQSRKTSNRSASSGSIRSFQSSTGSGTRVGAMPSQNVQDVGIRNSRKCHTASKDRSKTIKASKPLTIDLRLSSSDDSVDPYKTVQFLETGFKAAGDGSGAITSWW